MDLFVVLMIGGLKAFAEQCCGVFIAEDAASKASPQGRKLRKVSMAPMPAWVERSEPWKLTKLWNFRPCFSTYLWQSVKESSIAAVSMQISARWKASSRSSSALRREMVFSNLDKSTVSLINSRSFKDVDRVGAADKKSRQASESKKHKTQILNILLVFQGPINETHQYPGPMCLSTPKMEIWLLSATISFATFDPSTTRQPGRI